MIQGAETRLDGTTLVVRIPMRFQRRGGRKRIVAPDGSAIAPSSKPQPDGTLVKALARAWRWQRMLDDGVYASVSDIGDAENISKSYVSRILRLALLAPDMVEADPRGPAGSGAGAGEAGASAAGSWVEQRARIAEPKISWARPAARWRSPHGFEQTEPDGHDLLDMGCDPRHVLGHHRQLLILGQGDRQHHPAAGLELLQAGPEAPAWPPPRR